MDALSDVLNSVQNRNQVEVTPGGSSNIKNNNSRQVKFAPEPVMIASSDPVTLDQNSIDTTTAILQTALSSSQSAAVPIASVQSPLRNNSKVKGTIAVTDFSDPNKINKVLVSSMVPPQVGGASTDHTYATKETKTESSSSGDDTSSSSENEETVTGLNKVTPTTLEKVKQSVRGRGRPKKQDNSSTPVNGNTPQLRSILKPPPVLGDGKVTFEKVKRRGRGCGNCSGCLREDCGTCCYCLDKPKFGGPGKKKQRCALRICANFVSHSNSPAGRALQHAKSSLVDVNDCMKLLSNISSSSITTPPVTAKPEPMVTKLAPSTPVTSLATGATPTSKGPQAATPSSGRNTKSVTGSDEMIKCVACGRERKLSISRSNKFCSVKCLKDWEMLNPGKSPESAEPTDTVNIPLLLQAASLDKPAVPRALRNLQIDMALPGERHHDPNPNADILDIGPFIQSITGTGLSDTSISPPAAIAGSKRSNPDVNGGATPTKKPKHSVAIASSPITSPVVTSPPNAATGNKKKGKASSSPDISKWSIGDVVKYFENSDCSHIAPVLREQEVDGEALLLLSHDSLVKCLGIKLGPALKVMTHVDKLKVAQTSLF